jgi:hypothetical protein
MTASEFNALDRRIDKLILMAAAMPLLEHTMRPRQITNDFERVMQMIIRQNTAEVES